MNKKTRLAKLILLQIESLKEASKNDSVMNYTNLAMLANEITRDAEQLAQLVEQENANNVSAESAA